MSNHKIIVNHSKPFPLAFVRVSAEQMTQSCERRANSVREKCCASGQWAPNQAKEIIIEDKASGTLIQELVHDGVHGVRRYEPKMDKIMRMHNVSSTIENGFVHLPEKAEWLPEYLHELTTFPKGKHDDQADSTSQALDWVRQGYWGPEMGIFNYYRKEHEKLVQAGRALPRDN